MKASSSQNSNNAFNHLPILSFCFAALLLFLGCDKSDDNGGLGNDPFYKGAQQNADLNHLNIFWSIFEVNYQGKTAPVENLFANCDRTFFTYSANGAYKEFIISDSGCVPVVQELEWNEANGVIKLENSFKDFSEMVILELSATKFVFRAKYDFDEDGEEDVIQFLAKPYQPNEKNFYNNAIILDETVKDRYRFNWTEYNGINTFDRYEIYLSTENCDLSKATLVATINNKETTFYEDLNPAQNSQLCYFLKVFTDKGLLYESWAATASPEGSEIPSVELNPPVVQDGKIALEWGTYKGLFFSHYEVVVMNGEGLIGNMYQEKILAEITDKETNTFIDENPPTAINPVYLIRVVNKFGKKGFFDAKSYKSVTYKPANVVDLGNILQVVPSPNEPIAYVRGWTVNYGRLDIMRYNYVTNMVEATNNFPSGSDLNTPMRYVNSPVGHEIMVADHLGIAIYDAMTLEYKYTLKDNIAFWDIHDFIHLGGDRYLVITYQHAITITRDFSNITILDKQEHGLAGINTFNFNGLLINNNRVIIGHNELSLSTIFTIGQNGNLTNKTSSNIPITEKTEGETVFVANSNSIINFNQNRIYQLDTGSYTTFEQPYFPKAMNF